MSDHSERMDETGSNAQHEEQGGEDVMSFELLRNYFDKKFKEQNKQLQQKVTSDTKQLEKRLKLNEKKEGASLKFRGNQIQYSFNIDLMQSLEEIKTLVSEGSISRTTKKINKLITDLKKRNKCIRFADKSPAGWSAVDEYLSDELADNSDDDKRMKAAENRALAKRKSSKRKIGNQYQSSLPSSSTMSQPPQPAHFGVNHFVPRPPPPQPPPLDASGRPIFHGYQQQQQRYQKTDSICFACGKPGHWRKDCPGTN